MKTPIEKIKPAHTENKNHELEKNELEHNQSFTDKKPEKNPASHEKDVSLLGEQFKHALGKALQKKPNTCISIKKSESGWNTIIEIVEEEHIPSRFDTIGVYEAVFDRNGTLTSWERKLQKQRG
jgi:hypothetical protein